MNLNFPRRHARPHPPVRRDGELVAELGPRSLAEWLLPFKIKNLLLFDLGQSRDRVPPRRSFVGFCDTDTVPALRLRVTRALP